MSNFYEWRKKVFGDKYIGAEGESFDNYLKMAYEAGKSELGKSKFISVKKRFPEKGDGKLIHDMWNNSDFIWVIVETLNGSIVPSRFYFKNMSFSTVSVEKWASLNSCTKKEIFEIE